MSDEQRSAIKFCVRNGFSKSKTIDMLLNAYGEKAMKKQQSTCGINASKRAEKISRMISAAAVQASLRHLTSPPSGSYWIMIGASRSGILLQKLTTVTVQCRVSFITN